MSKSVIRASTYGHPWESVGPFMLTGHTSTLTAASGHQHGAGDRTDPRRRAKLLRPHGRRGHRATPSPAAA